MDGDDPARESNEMSDFYSRAEAELNRQRRARLWGELIEFVLGLEDIRPGLTFGEIAAMSDSDAGELADHMKAVFELRRSWRS